MNQPASLPVVFPPIGQHAAIGDQRTGALVAADGTINWWCLPEFDGHPLCAALLDPETGGFCRLGPEVASPGVQSYLPDTNAAVTRWPAAKAGEGAGELEITDLMAWPDDTRPPERENQRVILRRLRASGGPVRVAFGLHPRWNFEPVSAKVSPTENGGWEWRGKDATLGLWTTFPVQTGPDSASASLVVAADEEHWVMLGWNSPPGDWSAPLAAEVYEGALRYWRDWAGKLDLNCTGPRRDNARRTALTVQLLSHVKHGSAVAALTTSLPERPGGDRNYDYRYSWVRDSSLALSLLARLGKAGEVRCYLYWLSERLSSFGEPLHVVYGIDGRTSLPEKTFTDVRGYRDSLPIRIGNRAAKQHQIDSLAFMADCVRLYLENGGEIEDEFWHLVCRAADYTSRHWTEPGNGIWELDEKADYVEGRVMAWVVLERANWIANHTGRGEPSQLKTWREEAAAIHADVMERGWSEAKGAFRQRYDREGLDAAALLIPLMGFLPAEHPRVLSTLAALERELVVNGLMHRFNPVASLDDARHPLGQFEGAFLPCVFWHAHLLALLGRTDEADALLTRCETAAGPLGLFAEEMCSADDTFLGNTPLLFTHVEYIRAAIALHTAHKPTSFQPSLPQSS